MERYGFTTDAPEEEPGSNLLMALANFFTGLLH
jgi:hypothetical protein